MGGPEEYAKHMDRIARAAKGAEKTITELMERHAIYSDNAPEPRPNKGHLRKRTT